VLGEYLTFILSSFVVASQAMGVYMKAISHQPSVLSCKLSFFCCARQGMGVIKNEKGP
jgi:hypothetical protein